MALLLKIILILFALVVVWSFWRKPIAGRRQPPVSAEPLAQDMVSCAHCGVYLPQAESLVAEGFYYCSEAHRLAGGPKA